MFTVIFNFEHILQPFLVFQMLTLNKEIFVERKLFLIKFNG